LQSVIGADKGGGLADRTPEAFFIIGQIDRRPTAGSEYARQDSATGAPSRERRANTRE